MPYLLNTKSTDFSNEFDRFLTAKRKIAENVDHVVQVILAQVQAHKDKALIEYTQQFDHITLTPQTLRITQAEIDKALKDVSHDILDALKFAKQRIETYHRQQKPDDLRFTDDAGVTQGWRWTAVESAGLYVPGGTASYPSSVLMNAIPAKVAGVSRLVMCVPTPNGVLNPAVLVAAHIAGVDEIYRVGGAQAIGAMAYGTETIAPVTKIVGPGNAYVAAAKRYVFGVVGIDMIAGPSEVLILADKTARSDWVAVDLMAQAEHDKEAQAILITDNQELALNVQQKVDRLLETLPRRDIAKASWHNYGAVIVVDSLEQAIPLVDRIAPEHLEIETDNAEDLALRIRNAGAIFLGAYTPEAVGDYVAGPNHVLPTARSAKFSSGLNVLDFMKRSSILKCNANSLRKIGSSAMALAQSEGLDAHALSIAVRLASLPNPEK